MESPCLHEDVLSIIFSFLPELQGILSMRSLSKCHRDKREDDYRKCLRSRQITAGELRSYLARDNPSRFALLITDLRCEYEMLLFERSVGGYECLDDLGKGKNSCITCAAFEHRCLDTVLSESDIKIVAVDCLTHCNLLRHRVGTMEGVTKFVLDSYVINSRMVSKGHWPGFIARAMVLELEIEFEPWSEHSDEDFFMILDQIATRLAKLAFEDDDTTSRDPRSDLLRM